VALLGNLTGSAQFFNSDVLFYNGVATQSLRFDDGSSSYLKKTSGFSGATNSRKFTYSCWYKRANVDTGQNQAFLSAGSGASDFTMFYIDGNTQDVRWYTYTGGTDYGRAYSGYLKDPSAWYHLAIAVDTTKADTGGTYTDSDRVRVYLNGVLLDSVTTQYGNIPQNFDFFINNDYQHNIGKYTGNAKYLDGYLADVNFVDGTQIGDTNGILDEFIEIKNGVCIPKNYSGSYGNNGFRLQFKQTGDGSSTASSSTIGADTANSNHFLDVNMDAYDSNMPDCPENNFATWNALFRGGEASSSIAATSTLSEGNLQVSVPTNSYMGNTFRPTSGKWYCEIRVKTIGSTNGEIDWGWIQATTYAGTTGHSGQANKWGAYYHAYSTDHIQLYDETSQLGSNINLTISAGDVLQLAWDIDNNKGWVGINDTWYRTNASDGNPSSGTNETFTFTDDEAQNLQCYIANGTGTDVHVANFGQDSTFGGDETATTNADANGIGAFHHAPPTGFLALCTSNLPEPTIGPNSLTQADDYFNTVLFSGNGSGASVTGVGFQPDWIWAKNRTNSYSHELWDSSRGVNSDLQSDNANPEITDVNRLVSFDSDGFSYGASSNLYVNSTNSVAWNWKANGGTTSTISVGDVSSGVPSIASTVQVNATAGFSIVTFTGNGSDDATIGHGLGTTPAMIITKNRDETQQWRVHHKDLSQYYVLYLAEDYAQIATNGSSNGYIKTVGDDTYSTHASNVDSLGVNGSSDKMVSYCFAEIEGYSKFGSYTGNGSTDGTFVYTGFRPAWVMVKRTDSADNWFIHDSTRDTVNPNAHLIYADIPNNEYDATGDADNSPHDFTSNGFKFRSSNANWNGDGAAYIYMAFAEAPFKYANAR